MSDDRSKPPSRRPAAALKSAPYTLAIDIGGTRIKASVLDRAGVEIVQHVAVPTPHPVPPDALLSLLEGLARSLPPYDRISVGFPGVVKHGRIITAPNLGTADLHDFPLAAAVERRLRKPVRMLNDAEVQGLGVIEGKGLECVLTLGTGFGCGVYRDGELMPHLELGQHPIWRDKTYDQYLGKAALAAKGVDKWNRRVERMLGIVRTLLSYDHLYLGGGNATKVHFQLPPEVSIISNETGITGGIRLWDPKLDRFFLP